MRDTAEPSAREAREALALLLASERFRRSRRARELLTYLFEEALAGRGDSVKAFAIAVDVFGKDTSFDADNDTLVRVQAGRLRDLLETYYEGEGRGASLRFVLPRGGYALRIEADTPAPPAPAMRDEAVETAPRPARLGGVWRQTAAVIAVIALAVLAGLALLRPVSREKREPAREARPAVIRLLIAPQSADAQEHVLLQVVRDIAARFRDFDTVTRDGTAGDAATAWPEDYRIKIETIRLPDAAFVFLQAEHVASGTVVGAERTTLRAGDSLGTLLPVEQAMIRLLQPLGSIHADYRRRGRYSGVMSCVILTQDYLADQSDERHEKARRCAEAQVARGVQDSRLFTLLSYLHTQEFTDRRNPRAGDALTRAITAVQRALELDPADAGAHEQLMAVYALTGDFEQMMVEGRRAIALNPSSSAMLDNFAARLNYRGRHDEALELLLRAEQLQPVAPRWRAYAFFLAYYGLGRMPEAMARAATLSGTTNPLYIAARAIVARYKGDGVERNEALIALAKEERGYLKDPRAMYERRQYAPALVDRLTADLAPTTVAEASQPPTR